MDPAAYAIASAASARLTALFPSWRVFSEASSGSPAAKIIDRADSWKADLIVMGAVGHTAWERVVMGSVSYKVVNESRCSVRIIRPCAVKGDRQVRIVLGYDDMAGSRLAVETVARRKWPKGTHVRLHTAVGFGESPIAQTSIPEGAGHLREVLDPVENILREAGLKVSSNVVEDDPKLSIIAEADVFNAHCIFIGHNDHNLRSRLLIGTVASAVVSRAACSVEIVRPQVGSS
jgi:nucleotide-binding universal stress UspA family protein